LDSYKERQTASLIDMAPAIRSLTLHGEVGAVYRVLKSYVPSTSRIDALTLILDESEYWEDLCIQDLFDVKLPCLSGLRSIEIQASPAYSRMPHILMPDVFNMHHCDLPAVLPALTHLVIRHPHMRVVLGTLPPHLRVLEIDADQIDTRVFLQSKCVPPKEMRTFNIKAEWISGPRTLHEVFTKRSVDCHV